MSRSDPAIEEEALNWVIRTRDPEFQDWEAFTLWLEGGLDRAAAFDEALAVDAQVVGLLARHPPGPANDDGNEAVDGAVVQRRFGWIAGLAAMAALLLAVFVVVQWMPSDQARMVATASGEMRELTLEGGTRIALNGSTRLMVDPDGRSVELLAGEALFTVTHQGGAHFDVRVGGALVRDLGTVFNVARHDRVTEVAVAEGKVLYNPGTDAVTLVPGRRLRAEDGADTILLSSLDARDVGGWREGRLSFESAPLSDVAAAISRSSRITVTADPAVAGKSFTGTLLLQEDMERFLSDAAPVMGVSARRSGDGWILTADDDTGL